MNHSTARRAPALLLTALVVLPALFAPAAAHPETMTGFLGGTLSTTVTLAYPPRQQFVGTVSPLSNSTVTGGHVTLSGEPFSVPMNWTDSVASGFANGTFSSGAAMLPTGLSQRVVNGSTEFSGAGLDAGSYSGTTRLSGGVVLQGTSGSYTSPDITWNGVSYGRLIASVTQGFGTWAVTFDIVTSGGSLLQANVLPGALITVDGNANAAIRVRATFSAPTPNDSPTLIQVGAGYVLSDYMQTTAANRTLTRAANYAGSVELLDSFYNWTEYTSNPVFGPPGGTIWWSKGVLPSSAVQVGKSIWMYVSGIDQSDVMHIGRMVSSDGGVSWSVDSTPVLNSTAATWDSGYAGIPTVLYDGSTFKMWYMGAVTVDQFKVGYATSTDGVTWTKYGSNPVLSQGSGTWDGQNAGWPKVLLVGSTYYMFYAGRNTSDARKSIGYATSSDGIAWTKYASNPVVSWGSYTWGNYEAVASDVRYVGGVFYMYWTCSSGASAYDTCLSTSNNAQTWTHFNSNPVLTHGDATWDSITAELASVVWDPVTGHMKLIYTGRPGSASYSVGRADPRREGTGTYRAVWNLTGEVPRSYLAYDLTATTPASTSLQSSLQVSASGSVYGAPESVSTHDTVITSAPDTFLLQLVNLSTSDTRVSPGVSASRIAYDRFVATGLYTSAAHATPYPIDNATVTLSSTLQAGSFLWMNISNDGGATWIRASSGVRSVFPGPGVSFRYRLEFSGTSGRSATVASASVSLGIDSTPQGVKLLGPDGTVLALVAGDLSSAVTLPLDRAYFNARIAPFAASDPPFGVDIDLYVNASTAGIVHLDEIVLDVSIPDLLRVQFAPPQTSILVEEGSSQSFRIIASTTVGVPITYSWVVDGVASPVTGDLLTYFAALGSVGGHTVWGEASNGQFSVSQTWDVEVVAKPVHLAVSFYPGVFDLEVPVTLLQQFFASAVSSAGPPTITWNLDGSAAGTGSVFNYTAPATPGLHLLAVSVTNGQETLSSSWNITVTAVPEAPSRQFAVSFAPLVNLTLTPGATPGFFANVTGPTAGITYEWRLDGALTGSDASSYTFVASTANIGSHALTVFLHNTTALAAHSWTVNVLAAAPLPPTITINSPANGTTTTQNTVTLQGQATPGAKVFVGGVEVNVNPAGHFTADVNLAIGVNRIVVVARDSFDLTASAEVTVTSTYVAPPPPPPPGTTTTTEAGISTPSIAIMLVLAAALAAVTVLFMRERSRKRGELEASQDALSRPPPPP